VIYEGDEHGFHNPMGLYYPGQVDVVALGDSYVHGACVKSDQTRFSLSDKPILEL